MKTYLRSCTVAFAFFGLLAFLGFTAYIERVGHTSALNCSAAAMLIVLVLAIYFSAQAIGPMRK